jgi:hypothetical protein
MLCIHIFCLCTYIILIYKFLVQPLVGQSLWNRFFRKDMYLALGFNGTHLLTIFYFNKNNRKKNVGTHFIFIKSLENPMRKKKLSKQKCSKMYFVASKNIDPWLYCFCRITPAAVAWLENQKIVSNSLLDHVRLNFSCCCYF